MKKAAPYFTQNDDFEAIIKTHFAAVNDLLLIKTGWTNFVFRVATPQGIYYFRFPRNAFFAEALLEEYSFLEFVKYKVSFVTPDLKIYYHQNRPYSIHAEIAGETLADCYHDLTTDEKQAVARAIADALHQLAQIDTHATKGIKFQRLSDFLDGLAGVSQNNYDLARHDFLKALEAPNLVCCHGDFNPGNIILQDHQFYGVIDFAFAGISSELIDLSRIVGRTPRDFKPLLVTAFEQRFGTAVDPTTLAKIQDIWQYVEEKYILYIKQNHPWIVLPSLV